MTTKLIPGQILFAVPAICSEHTAPSVVFYMGTNARGQVVCDYNEMRLILAASDVFPLTEEAEWEVKRRLSSMEIDIEVSFDSVCGE